jgi:hypothetical protein
MYRRFGLIALAFGAILIGAWVLEAVFLPGKPVLAFLESLEAGAVATATMVLLNRLPF